MLGPNVCETPALPNASPAHGRAVCCMSRFIRYALLGACLHVARCVLARRQHAACEPFASMRRPRPPRRAGRASRTAKAAGPRLSGMRVHACARTCVRVPAHLWARGQAGSCRRPRRTTHRRPAQPRWMHQATCNIRHAARSVSRSTHRRPSATTLRGTHYTD